MEGAERRGRALGHDIPRAPRLPPGRQEVKGSVVFLETSALLRALLREDGADEVHGRLEEAERVVASRLLRVEAERALLRLALGAPRSDGSLPELERQLAETWPHLELWDISEDVCDLAGRIAPRAGLRSLDAIHLATFHRLRQQAPEATMLSFDQRLLDALGLAP
ncbi:MAG: type II toxin-antitoxin system VapC family toxin [Myxococcales bacterium]